MIDRVMLLNIDILALFYLSIKEFTLEKYFMISRRALIIQESLKDTKQRLRICYAFFSVDQNVLINIISYETNVKINRWKTIDESKNLNKKKF